MSPPDLTDGKMPFVLYNLGGCLMNFLTAALFSLPIPLEDTSPLFYFFRFGMITTGLSSAICNGIPLTFNGISNDGRNILTAWKDPAVLRAFWVQLKIAASAAQGHRLRDMPNDWFIVPSHDKMDNSLIATIAAFASIRLMDQGYYREADELMAVLIGSNKKFSNFYKNTIALERLCIELIDKNRPEVVNQLYTNDLRKHMKSMKKSPSVIRTQYIYALLSEHNQGTACTILQKFEKIAKNHPIPTDLELDRELMMAALQKYENEA